MIHYKITPYGFEYGSMDVCRVHSSPKQHWVVLGVTTRKTSVQIYATKTGKVRVWIDHKEVRDK